MVDSPEDMYKLNDYWEMLEQLDELEQNPEVKSEINGGAEAAVTIVQEYLEDAKAGYDTVISPFKLINAPVTFDRKIKTQAMIDKVKWPTVNADECRFTLESLQRLAKSIYISNNPLETNNREQPLVVQLAIEKYNLFIDAVRGMLFKLTDEVNPVQSMQEELDNLVLAQAPLVKDARRRAVEYYEGYQADYNAVRSKIYFNLTDRDQPIKELKSQLDESVKLAANVRKVVQARYNVAERQKKVLDEFVALISKKLVGVNGEFFEKIKEKILMVGETGELIKKIQRYAVRYPIKAQEINKFNTMFNEQKNLQDLVLFLELACQDPVLNENRSAIGKFFRIKSGLSKAIKKLKEEVDKVIEQEKRDYAILNSIFAEIKTERYSLFPATRTARFELIKSRLFQIIDQCKEPALDKLKSEVIDISFWKNQNSAKISRLVREVLHTSAHLALKSDAAGKAAYGLLQKFYKEVKEGLSYRDEDFKFSSSYQKLKAHLRSVKTNRSTSNFWLEIDKIAAGREVEEEKYELMRQKVLNYYYSIRQSSYGSAGKFFGNGSRLGDALERFLTHPNGLNISKHLVPHRIGSSRCVPSLKLSENDVLWVNFKF